MLAGDQLGKVTPLLLVVAVARDLIDAEIGMGAVGEADRGRGAAHLLDRDAMLRGSPGRARHIPPATVMPCRPSAPIFGQRSRGNTLSRSISAARGAISASANARGRFADHFGALAEVEIEGAGGVGDHGASLTVRDRGPNRGGDQAGCPERDGSCPSSAGRFRAVLRSRDWVVGAHGENARRQIISTKVSPRSIVSSERGRAISNQARRSRVRVLGSLIQMIAGPPPTRAFRCAKSSSFVRMTALCRERIVPDSGV